MCDVVSKNKYSLAAHVKEQHKKMPCSFCGIMMSESNVRKHIKSRHTDNNLKPHQCKLCKKGFGIAKNLEMHMNIHTGARPYLCNHCGKSYANQGNCRMHERTAHEGYKTKENYRKKSKSATRIIMIIDKFCAFRIRILRNKLGNTWVIHTTIVLNIVYAKFIAEDRSRVAYIYSVTLLSFAHFFITLTICST